VYKNTLLATLAVAACTLAAPAVAAATTVPSLPSGIDQAYIADGDGNPESGTMTLTGQVQRSTGGVTITCNHHAEIDFDDDGTTAVTSFSTSGCTSNVPTCSVSVFTTNLNWGNRFGYDPVAGTFHDYINVSASVTLSGPACPVPGTFPSSGTLFPVIDITSGVLTMAFSASTGTLTNSVGPETWIGTLTSSSGIGADTQLVF